MTALATGRLCIVTRRHVRIWGPGDEILEGTLASKELDTCAGDLVEYQHATAQGPEKRRRPQVVVQQMLPRKNCLKRSYGKKTKLLAANVDRLFLVAAPEPTLNTVAVDRVLISAALAGIPYTLVMNKLDLKGSYEQLSETLAVYRQLQIPLLEVSAIDGTGIAELTAMATAPENTVVVLGGISGVGKSTILNNLLPGTDVRTQEVSRKTGQGRQTTSQAVGHCLERPPSPPLMLIDLPGIQQFGICHLTEQEIRSAFTEFAAKQCRFANCSHTNEPDCMVLAGVEDGSIASFRHASYLSMIDELRRNREF